MQPCVTAIRPRESTGVRARAVHPLIHPSIHREKKVGRQADTHGMALHGLTCITSCDWHSVCLSLGVGHWATEPTARGGEVGCQTLFTHKLRTAHAWPACMNASIPCHPIHHTGNKIKEAFIHRNAPTHCKQTDRQTSLWLVAKQTATLTLTLTLALTTRDRHPHHTPSQSTNINQPMSGCGPCICS